MANNLIAWWIAKASAKSDAWVALPWAVRSAWVMGPAIIPWITKGSSPSSVAWNAITTAQPATPGAYSCLVVAGLAGV